MNLHLLAVISFFCFMISVHSQNVRPIRDSVGFSWYPNEMDSLISYLNSTQPEVFDNNNYNLIAGISPHDDYLYAARIYYPLYKKIRTKEVVIFGVTHGTVRKAMNDPKDILIFEGYEYWKGTYGNVKVSELRDLIKEKLNKKYFIVSNRAQNIEHSIEALIPFLQYYNRNIKITPIMVTSMPFERMDEITDSLSLIIYKYINQNKLVPGKDIFFLFSTDANHYGDDFNNSPYGTDTEAHRKAVSRDKEIADNCLTGPIDKSKIKRLSDDLGNNSNKKGITPLWCGRYPVPFGLMTTNKILKLLGKDGLNGKLFNYSDTYTEGVIPIKGTHLGLTAPFSLKHWVGFLSAGYYLK